MEMRKAHVDMIKAYPGGWDAMAAALGMSRASLENRLYERKGQGLLGDTSLQIQAFSGTTLYAEAVATASGGTFVLLPDVGECGNDAVLRKFQELYADLGTFSAHFAEATADDVINAAERKILASDVARLHRVIAQIQELAIKVYGDAS
jgi:hypothetical protein